MVRLTDRPDMTLDVYCGRKTTTQQQQQKKKIKAILMSKFLGIKTNFSLSFLLNISVTISPYLRATDTYKLMKRIHIKSELKVICLKPATYNQTNKIFLSGPYLLLHKSYLKVLF